MSAAELLAPAPSPEALDAAIGEGADAVYLTIKDAGARTRSTDFNYSRFEAALRALHRMGRKLYVTVDTVFQQREADRIYQLLKYLAAIGPDAIIVQDFGIISMVRENFPSLKLHASTQMNVASARGINLLSRHGFSRTVLARELSLDEIRLIRSNTNMELEVFVHGGLCVSASGLCLFSSYLGGKSANRGICTQACRRFYTAYKGKGFEAGPAGGESGGYYFSPADLMLLEKIPDLTQSGVNAFRIEGRMKSADYVGTVVSAYRLVMDNLDAGEEQLKQAFKEARNILKNDFARPKTSYLINSAVAQKGGTGVPADGVSGGEVAANGVPAKAGIDWLNPEQSDGIGIPLGTLLRVKGREEEYRGLVPDGLVALFPGDSVRLHKKDDSERLSHKLSFVEGGPDGGSWISIPEGFTIGDSVYLIHTKGVKRYKPVIAREGGSKKGQRILSRDKAPLPAADPGKIAHNKGQKAAAQKTAGEKTASQRAAAKRRASEDLPAGIYAMVSRIEDLYILQSIRPEKVILPLSRKCAKQLLGNTALPFPTKDIILSLDPFFPQGDEKDLEAYFSALIEKGYQRFIVNNLGYFSLFRGKDEGEKAILIAGPWLYSFNAWAWDFISRCGAGYGISPLENNRQNLEKTFPGDNPSLRSLRSRIFITVFSRPSLFRIRQDLGGIYDFDFFASQRAESNETFQLATGVDQVSSSEGTNVYPYEPFSIVDKIPFLKEAGFSRFILDFSPGPLRKAEYRDIMEAVMRVSPLPGTNRFNWKNGFYQEQPVSEAAASAAPPGKKPRQSREVRPQAKPLVKPPAKPPRK